VWFLQIQQAQYVGQHGLCDGPVMMGAHRAMVLSGIMVASTVGFERAMWISIVKMALSMARWWGRLQKHVHEVLVEGLLGSP
jgi:type IV secretory pathway TrbD component